ncbi:hypothetical protein IAU60_003203 [Kwoniella sp. DSM 27419]
MSLPDLTSAPSDRILIVGSGIVGSCLAAFLAPSLGPDVILLDRDIRGLPGSTGHAPGFVGQFNEIPTLTELARRSVVYYQLREGRGFDTVGNLEVGPGLEARAAAALAAGFEARLLEKQETLEIAPGFVRPDTLEVEGPAAILFPGDGTAKAIELTHAVQDDAKAAGAVFIGADVLGVSTADAGVHTVTTSLGELQVGRVVLCTGIWASQLLPKLEHSVVSVAHPYSYSTPHEVRQKETPFIRWPAKHVYARDHGTEDGLGSYAHAPIKLARGEHTHSAYGEWDDSFDQVLEDGYALLPDAVAGTFKGGRKFNGLFSVTPDGLPLVGQVDQGVYCAVGIWVTHAAGSAQLLADQLLGRAKDADKTLREALDPKRFEGHTSVEALAELEQRALAKYNDIYNKEN